MPSDPSQDENISKKEAENMSKAAGRRSSFKVHAAVFVLANILFWLVWFFIFREEGVGFQDDKFLKFILFVTLAWLVFIIGHFLFAYKWSRTFAEKELRRLQKQRRKQQKKIGELQKAIDSANRELKEGTETDNNQQQA